jgi:hypothetical protein
MADIRVQHVKFLLIEQQANAPGFRPAEIPALLKKLEALIAKAPSLSQRFIDLNKEDFYLSDLEEENRLRNYKISAFYERLKKSR